MVVLYIVTTYTTGKKSALIGNVWQAFAQIWGGETEDILRMSSFASDTQVRHFIRGTEDKVVRLEYDESMRLRIRKAWDRDVLHDDGGVHVHLGTK